MTDYAGDVLALVLAVAIMAAVLAPLLLRDTGRAEQRQRLREAIRTGPSFQRMAREFEAFQRQVGEAFLPVMIQMAAATTTIAEAMVPMAKAMRRFDERG